MYSSQIMSLKFKKKMWYGIVLFKGIFLKNIKWLAKVSKILSRQTKIIKLTYKWYSEIYKWMQYNFQK